MNFRQPLSKFKNQILTAQKRDQFYAELDLTKDAIGNDSARTVQANSDTVVFSCGHGGVGFVPLSFPGKFGFAHQKISCGHVSDIHISPFIYDRLLAVSCSDQSVRIYRVPDLRLEEEDMPSALHEFRASSGSANTPVLVCWNPQVSGVLAIGSGSKIDIFSLATDTVERTIDVSNPVIAMDWSHDGCSVLAISKDAVLRIIDVRKSEKIHEIKLSGTKHVIKTLPERMWVISSLSRMRERELNLYSFSDPGMPLNSWNFGTASTPLIPILDTVRKVVYLLDKSGGTLRWIEMISPYNEGAASTSVDQSSSGCLVHPFGLQIMDGEINRLLIADTKGNTVPVRITIGRKSYVEFHEDLFTPIEVESTVAPAEWLNGRDGMAKMAKVNPTLLAAASKGETLTRDTFVPTPSRAGTSVVSTGTAPAKIATEPDIGLPKGTSRDDDVEKVEQTPTLIKDNLDRPQGKVASDPILSGREQRKWDRENAKAASAPPSSSSREEREVYREDLSARRAEYGSSVNVQDSPSEEEKKSPTVRNEAGQTPDKIPASDVVEKSVPLGKGRAPLLDDEDALERMRSRRVTPAIEAQSSPVQIATPQPQREVYREDLSARRAEYGATPHSVGRAIPKENFGAKRAESGAVSDEAGIEAIVQASSTASKENSESLASSLKDSTNDSAAREVYREDLSSRRAEYGAPSKLNATATVDSPRPYTPTLSAREQRKWDKGSGSVADIDTAAASNMDKISASSSEAPSSFSPNQPLRTSTAEREVFREDLNARRAEYGAVTPILSAPTTAYKEIQKALGNDETHDSTPLAEGIIPYKVSDALHEPEDVHRQATVAELENVYAPPIEEGKINAKVADLSITDPAAIVDKIHITQSPEKLEHDATKIRSSAASEKQTLAKEPVDRRDYTRKYLQGKPQHPRNSYTSLVGLNASLPNTARMIHTTPKYIAIPLAGPGGRIAIIPTSRAGRLPPLLSGFTGGAQLVDFELDKFKHDRLVSAHVDQTIKVWTIPGDFEDLENDLDTPDHLLKGMDRILALSLHPLVKDFLMVTTTSKIHLFDIDKGEEVKVFAAKGVANSCWSLDGNQIAIGRSDKSIVVLDAKSGDEISSFPSAHSSTRPFRLHFVGEDKLITAGFGRASTRQLALYNVTTGDILQVYDMDISPSPFALPHFDEMSSILYLIPRGSSNILPFHVTSDSIVPLSPYAAADPIMGTSFLAPQDLSIKEVEIARCARLSTNEITVVGFHIPRPAGDLFHDDIYPLEVTDAYTSNQDIKQWLGREAPGQHKKINLNADNLRGATAAGVGSVGQKSAPNVSKTPIRAREPEEKKPSELEQMFNKAKGQEGDEPENTNKNKNTEWD